MSDFLASRAIARLRETLDDLETVMADRGEFAAILAADVERYAAIVRQRVDEFVERIREEAQS